jgi:hypothetical protein
MALHLARSDRSIGCREKRYDEMMLAIILLRIVDHSIVGRGEGKIECLSTDQLHFFCGLHIWNREKK